METEEEDDTNDEDFNLEIRQFSSCSHRFSKVSKNSYVSMYYAHKHFATFIDFGNARYGNMYRTLFLQEMLTEIEQELNECH